MRKDIMENADLSAFAEVGLILFVIAFIAIFLRAFFMRRETVEHLQQLPLEDSDGNQQFKADEKGEEVYP